MRLMTLLILLLSQNSFGSLMGYDKRFRRKKIYYGFKITDSDCPQQQARSFRECEMLCSVTPSCSLVSAFQEYFDGDIVCQICRYKLIHTVNVQAVDHQSSGIIYHIDPFYNYPADDGIFTIAININNLDKKEDANIVCEVDSGRLGIIKTKAQLEMIWKYIWNIDEKATVLIDLNCTNDCTWGDGTRCQNTELVDYCPEDGADMYDETSKKKLVYSMNISANEIFMPVKVKDVTYQLCQYNPFGFVW